MKRALIELDPEIEVDGFGQYVHFKEKYLQGKEMSDFFDLMITDAFDKKLDVWEAVLTCDEIWVDSSYIGNSGRLLTQMLQMALENGIKDKKLINMNKYTDVMWHIADDQRELIRALSTQNNIDFVYADEPEYKKLFI